MAQGKLELKKFKNGLKVLVYPMEHMNSVSIGIWVKMGGRFETNRYKGISHFLEHMVFKGSKKYSCRKIKESLEGVGGALNAFTSEENTCYLVKIPARYVNKAIDVLSDMVLFPTLDVDDLERERLVIFEEIRMYMDLPQSYVVELAQELLWQGHNLGRPLAGTIESVGRITPQVIRSFQQVYYKPNNIAVVLAGRVDKDVLDMIASIWESVPKGRKVRENPFGYVQKKAKLKFFQKDTEQSHLCLAIPAYSYMHPKKYALEILNVILGGNMSSRLFNEVREKRGLVYHISSMVSKMKDTGGLFIKAGTEHKSLAKTVEIILRELEKIQKGKISKGEFKRAKEFLLGQFMIHLEDTMENMLMLGSRLINMDQVVLPSQIIGEIEKVDLEDVRAVAKELFLPEKYNLAVIGPVELYEEKVRKMF